MISVERSQKVRTFGVLLRGTRHPRIGGTGIAEESKL
jgi:hypothetical protein